jgi:hypothetical protein
MDVPVVMTAVRLPAQELVLDPVLRLAAVLPKPFYISQLVETVKAVLGATDHPGEPVKPLRDWRNRPSAAGLRPR